MTKAFPDSMDFSGYNAPSRVECDVYDLVVEGNLPAEINGSWFQTVPDPQYPPMLGHDTYLSGDGMMRLLRFENGHVDLKQRYIHTERFKNERRARRSLYGLYRNPYTDDPSVRGKPRGVNNTTPIYHAGRLLALKEDSRAMEIDPHTLETLGEWDYRGKLRSATMTAHTRPDPRTGELYFFGYEAGGLASRDVAYCVANRDGELIREDWFQVPYCSMMHDFAVTREHAIFPVFPTTADLDRIRAGGPHWIWEPTRDTYIGIMPRDGSVRDLRWFRGPARSAYHFMNAYTDGPRVHLDFGCGKVNPFPFIQAASGIQVNPQDMAGAFVRWTFDLSRPGEGYEETVLGPGGDLPRAAEKDGMADYEVGYYQTYDPAAGPPLLAGPVGAGFNTLLRLEVRTGRLKAFAPGEQSTVQEHFHIPAATPGHEGYLGFIVDRHAENRSEVFVLEAANPERGPLARIKVPFRLRVGVHGNWVPAEALRAARFTR
ncbi:MAG TPA: carotenoid oxygenase family protein, partial [Steroidobacteraceae bacterium]|nr:carotenoid oxygenase family protein [Steroidobacteraceae bacterium]